MPPRRWPAAAAAGAVVAVGRSGLPPAPPLRDRRTGSGRPTVVRTDLAATVLTGGTLGYAPADPVVNRVAGTYTGSRGPAPVIAPGESSTGSTTLPVVLMTGSVPAWRPFGLGMTDGPDVGQLQANLIAGERHWAAHAAERELRWAPPTRWSAGRRPTAIR